MAWLDYCSLLQRQYAAASGIRGRCAMQGLPDRLGDWVLSIIERLVPSAVGFEDYSSLIGYLVILGLALIVVWSITGLVRR